MKKIVIICCLFYTPAAHAQEAAFLTIADCYRLAQQHYPLVKQRELIDKTASFSINNLSKGLLPQVHLQAQASYQSEVTQFPIKIPGVDIPVISKDQYKVYTEVSQILYDGGLTNHQKQLQQTQAIADQQKLEVALYQLKERINQLFFGILLIDEQLLQNELLKKDIRLGISKTEAQIAHGAALPANAAVLKAAWLHADQHAVELRAARKAYADMLGLFINQSLNSNTKLAKPHSPAISPDIRRPELLMYDYQARSLNIQDQLLKARNRPRLNLFVQGGAGRPALNMLKNDFKPYYIGGFRMTWHLSGLYTSGNDRAIIDISRRQLDLQKETFLFNTNLSLQQQNADIGKLQRLLSSDDEIIALRASVKQSSFAQLENGIINTSDYLREVTAEDQARQNRILHGIQLLMIQYNQQTTTGNEPIKFK